MKETPTSSTLLLANPSFLEGFARTIDIGGYLTEYNVSLSPAQADRMALLADLNSLRQELALVRKQMAINRHGE